MSRIGSAIALLATLSMPSIGLAADQGVRVDGVVGVTPVGDLTCVAVWIPIPPGKALSGVRWYNNDAAVEFPRLLLSESVGAEPGPVGEAMEVASAFHGASSDWSEVAFSQPIVSGNGGLFAILQLPAGSEQQSLGTGGGAGVGYGDGQGQPAWVTLEGEDWVCLAPDIHLAITPVFVQAPAGATTLSKRLGGATAGEAQLSTALRPAHPNPFNPKTTISFTLARACGVDLRIYNLRGQLVRALLNETRGAGAHAIDWLGTDGSDRQVPSGVYLARLQADGSIMSQRLLLVK